MRAASVTTLLLVRHPHTWANEGGGSTLTGWTDAPLSPRGRGEAALLRDRLCREPGGIEIYTSPLRRARSVADALAAVGFSRVTCDAALREICCGEVDGWDVDRVRRTHPILWRRNAVQDDPDFRWPGGESYREFRARCVGAMARIAGAHPGERVVVITHAGVVSQVLGDIAGTGSARWDAFRPGNASLTTIAWSGRERRVIAFDDRAHLGDARELG